MKQTKMDRDYYT